MKASKITVGIATLATALALSAGQVMAQVIAQTWVSGTVYNSSHVPVSGGSITVHCGSATQVASIGADGNYGVSFSQTDCKAGDTASATASTSDGSGSNAATVENTTVNGPIVDLDVAVVDITVPEFGMIGGMVTMLGAAGSYLYMRAKSLV